MTTLACPPGEDILDGIIEHMAHGENTSHIWGWNNYGVGGFIRIGTSLK